MFRTILICFVLAGIAMPLPLSAQQPPSATQQTQNIKRTPLQKFDVPGTNYETVIGLAEIVPNVNIGRLHILALNQALCWKEISFF